MDLRLYFFHPLSVNLNTNYILHPLDLLLNFLFHSINL